jgi:hypothetical protein
MAAHRRVRTAQPSEFTYQQLTDPDDIVREGPLSRSPNVRHAQTGDTGRYDGREVEALAFRLASGAVGGLEPKSSDLGIGTPLRRLG